MLIESTIKRLKAKAARYRLTDSDGLYLEVMPTGRKFWRVRLTGENGTKVQTVGEWPSVSLYDARAERDKIKQKILTRPAPSAVTFFDLAHEWNEKKNMPSAGSAYAKQKFRWLEKYVFPFIGDLSPNEVTPRVVLDLARAVEARGLRDVPRGIVQVVGCVLRYGIVTGQAERDVSADLRGTLVVHPYKHHPAFKTKQELGDFLRVIWGMRSSAARRLLMFIVYTFVRSSEARLATWDEIDFDTATWKVPEERMKMRRPHIIPLSRQAVEVLKEGIEYRSLSKWVFPSPLRDGEPMNKQVLINFIRQLGYRQDQLTIHGFRSIASTTLYEAGWDGNAIERQLAHADRNRIRAAYNYAEYLGKRRDMMQWYADYLDDLRNTPQNA